VKDSVSEIEVVDVAEEDTPDSAGDEAADDELEPDVESGEVEEDTALDEDMPFGRAVDDADADADVDATPEPDPDVEAEVDATPEPDSDIEVRAAELDTDGADRVPDPDATDCFSISRR
jgi:hypothetical protein